MIIASKSRTVIERMKVFAKAGDPELCRLLTETDWQLDWHVTDDWGLIREIKTEIYFRH